MCNIFIPHDLDSQLNTECCKMHRECQNKECEQLLLLMEIVMHKCDTQ